jgi:hypothetical protein
LALGEEFGAWMIKRGSKFYELLLEAQETWGKPVVRFRTTWMCTECNPTDGNRKPARKAARPDDTNVTYYSMLPDQLASCRTLEDWQQAYENDRNDLERRLREVRRLATEEARVWLSKKSR